MIELKTLDEIRHYIRGKARSHSAKSMRNLLEELARASFDPSSIEALYKVLQPLQREGQRFRSSLPFESYSLLLVGNILSRRGCSWKVVPHAKRSLYLDQEIGRVTMNFDMIVEVDGKETLMEVKKNIDNVERDLLKFFLVRTLSTKTDARTAIVVMEDRENISQDSGRLLRWSEKQGYLDKWFYLYLSKHEFEHQLSQLSDFLIYNH